MLVDLCVKDFIEEVSSSSPAPGGGSVAALSGSLAAALVSMVARLTVKMTEADDQARQQMQHILAQVTELMKNLATDVDGDAAAFNQVMAAYKLSKETLPEREQRSRTIQLALQGATEHPLRVAEKCLKLLGCCQEAVRYGNPHAISDIGVAALMSYSGIVGSLFNVAINLGSLKDEALKEGIRAQKKQIMSEADRLRHEVMEALSDQLY